MDDPATVECPYISRNLDLNRHVWDYYLTKPNWEYQQWRRACHIVCLIRWMTGEMETSEFRREDCGSIAFDNCFWDGYLGKSIEFMRTTPSWVFPVPCYMSYLESND